MASWICIYIIINKGNVIFKGNNRKLIPHSPPENGLGQQI